MVIKLAPHQIEAIEELADGKILKGGVGTGKSRVALGYFFSKVLKGTFPYNGQGDFGPPEKSVQLYVITTGKKRDSLDWEKEAAGFAISTKRESSYGGVAITVDSWNNIAKYTEVKDAFFIFDEQRLVGSGSWVKAFLKIAKANRWIVLSATPGDSWMDYIPVFIARGYYKNRTEFIRTHVVYNNFSDFPKIDHYIATARLERYRRHILVEMPYQSHTIRHPEYIMVDYDEAKFEKIWKKRWNIYEEKPLKDIAEMLRVARRLINTDVSRLGAVMEVLEKHPKLIIFYTHNYELELLRTLGATLSYPTAEWNGHKHEEIPESEKWLYLVQYTSGAEGWNCTTTNAILYFSLTYSYKLFKQSQGRIDRLNTPFIDLYYYILTSSSLMDKMIRKALNNKQNFNERVFKSSWEEKSAA